MTGLSVVHPAIASCNEHAACVPHGDGDEDRAPQPRGFKRCAETSVVLVTRYALVAGPQCRVAQYAGAGGAFHSGPIPPRSDVRVGPVESGLGLTAWGRL
jgi:hypothetical protein